MGRKVCVVTGATSGIGRATALALGEANTDLVILGRNEGAGASLLAKLQRRGFGNASTFIQIDLADFENVRRAAGHIRRKYSKIHVLVNNAGARFNDYETTVDGLERTFATNHLGHFLLTALLLDVLLSSAARVITVGSGAHAVSPEGSWLLTRETYDRKVAYGRSKLANIMFAYELARRLQRTSVVSNALDPGGVATNLGRNNGLVPWASSSALLCSETRTAHAAAGRK